MENKMNSRILFLSRLFVIFGIIIFLRFLYLQIISYESLDNLANKQHLDSEEITPERGFIYDRKGRELAISVDVPSVYAITYQINNKIKTAKELSNILKISKDDLLKKFNCGKSFVWIDRKVSFEKGKKIKMLKLKGINIISESKRFYPKDEMCAHILGFVDIDGKGLEGIEYYLDKFLCGKKGYLNVVKDAKGREIISSNSTYLPSNNGYDVYLTIDEAIQSIVEEELRRVNNEFSPKEATIIVMKPDSGEILALANQPSFNPNNFYNFPQQYLKNRAISLLFEPGSVFKIVTLAGALSEAITTEDEMINCENGEWKIYNHKINDHIKYKMLKFEQVIGNSSNIGTAKIGMRLGNSKLYDYAKLFGFGEKTGIQLVGEVRGILREPKKWSKISVCSISIGQEVGVTPIQLVSAISVMANKGKLMQPLIVRYIKDRQNNLIKEFKPKEIRQVISEDIAKRVMKILKGAVENGTGKEAKIPGYSAAGKTGTAQKIDPKTKKYSTNKFVASFGGFVPADVPKIVIFISIDEPNKVYWGGSVAAPAFSRIGERVLRYLEKENYDVVRSY
ncbi:MAG: penicillin-binding transpeptidase domain-containing protein [Candidatus Firestonebacteria bacterium]